MKLPDSTSPQMRGGALKERRGAEINIFNTSPLTPLLI